MDRNLTIKNMVCPRCLTAVEAVLRQEDIPYTKVQLGLIQLPKRLHNEQLQSLKTALHKIGFEILTDPKEHLVEKIKVTLLELINHPDQQHIKLSVYLSETLQTGYQTLSNIFSEIERTTIEKYFIRLKIEKVKELLTYNEYSLKEIAFLLHYSSVAHLSKQFKDITKRSPSEFKMSTAQQHRIPLDQL
ncbi:helix-turn-helix domain-containing protein [Sphingobacterium lumbrici]|uniref:helix-turn-helix domain-containing protein n=1 Tax=Sphingobacterium lumbrici TaxID=2559600 RepID=UPI001126B457|nr:AraC family transcriptional regulator [Sphingobacterium lumbrici]